MTVEQLEFLVPKARMDLVESKLWIGNLDSALDVNLLQERGITHVVTVDIKPLPPNGHLQYLFIPAHDVPTQDLFTHFPSVFQFVEAGKLCGGVLVHCFHGVSRSAALVVSYLLRKYHLSTDESLSRLQAVRPSVLPNEGFLAQLRLYETLLELDALDSVVTRWYCLQQLGVGDHQTAGDISANHPNLKCKSCRHVLADGRDIIHHQAGQKADWKDLSWVRHALSDRQSRKESCQSAFFLIPSEWMSMNGAPQGKLLCPKCQSKVGAFSWNQCLKCPCAAPFRPGFYLTPSRVDFISTM